MAKPARKSRTGPKLPYARIERAVEYRMLGYKWGEIETLVGIPHSTLMRWYATPDWKAMEADWQAQDPLVRRAKAVLAKALMVELGKKVPNTALAERILAPRVNGDGDGPGPSGYTAHPGVVLLPLQNKGLESKTPAQVLMQPAPVAPVPEPPPPLTKPGKRMAKQRHKNAGTRRRVVGPDE